jgi:hypothetical protein
MKWQATVLVLAVLTANGLAQEATPRAPTFTDPVLILSGMNAQGPVVDFGAPAEGPRESLSSDLAFPGFIGYISNPAGAIDPRSLTQLFPIFGANWIDATRVLPSGDLEVYGAGLTLALSERLSVGLTQGGYFVGHFNHERQGWQDLGGFAQYTLVRDVEDQFLATGGLRWAAPSGSSAVFQGFGPVNLAPYATVGKQFGEAHILNTVGFQFPCGSGNVERDTFYGTLHLDRRMFGWLYPLVEFNWALATANVDLSRSNRPGILDINTITANGSVLTVAPGFNAVIVQDKLEIGAVYQTPIATQHSFNFNEVIVKMVIRF